MAARLFTVSDAALAEAEALPLFGDTRRRLVRMARRAAPVTHPDGNRRFHDFVLRIEDGEIRGVTTLDT